ncbi:MAG: hypothetical protein V7L05_14835 [Nostoc sp.]|uniref:hypothetical protein n=1 Tax=Nostoc sp. TaxID=1180 RepID=UPI002FFA2D20
MAESDEHRWLSRSFLEILESFSRLDLYSFTEADRKKFDFACLLQRDFIRPLVGQTLWKHTEGIDKDIRTLIAASDSDIWAYIARDNIRNRALFYEVIRDFQQTEHRRDLYKLKLFWIPENFEVGSAQSEQIISFYLRDQIVNDVLMNVVFGKLTASDVRFFLNNTGIPGLHLAVLYDIANYGFISYTKVGRRLSTSTTTLRPRYQVVLGSGFIYEPYSREKAGYSAFVSLKGRVFLKLIQKVYQQYCERKITPELEFILRKLDIEPNLVDPIPPFNSPEVIPLLIAPPSPEKFFKLLIGQIRAAQSFGVELNSMNFIVSDIENESVFNIVR